MIIMSEKRVTKKERFGEILGILEGMEGTEALVEFVNKEIETLGKRKSAKTATQKENEVLVEKLFNILAKNAEAMTATQVLEAAQAEGVEGVNTNQKVSALLKKLVDAGRVVKVMDKKKAYFSVDANEAEADEDTE